MPSGRVHDAHALDDVPTAVRLANRLAPYAIAQGWAWR